MCGVTMCIAKTIHLTRSKTQSSAEKERTDPKNSNHLWREITHEKKYYGLASWSFLLLSAVLVLLYSSSIHMKVHHISPRLGER